VTGNSSVPESGEELLAAFLEAHVGSLEKFIAGRVRGDAYAVEDLLQQTIMYVVASHDREGGLPAGEEAVRLLFTIARRRIINWYERNGKADLYPSDSALLAEAVVNVDLIDETVIRQVDVARAMAQLTPRQQRALVLVYFDDLDYRTAAAAMGISVDGLKKHLSSAKARARQLDELTGYGKPVSAEGGAQ
jgi:RNA polymerase sigma factor (sigma-70 family)